jgi:hypothetical protein
MREVLIVQGSKRCPRSRAFVNRIRNHTPFTADIPYVLLPNSLDCASVAEW